MQFFDFSTERYAQIIATLIVILVFILIKRFADTIVKKFGIKSNFSEVRTQLVKKYIDILLVALLFVVLVSIWGVKPDQIFLFISSVLTVIGVAFFAQWSILSNVPA